MHNARRMQDRSMRRRASAVCMGGGSALQDFGHGTHGEVNLRQ